MTRAAAILGYVLGLTSIVGGILGYVRAASVPSLAAGVGVGALAVLAAWGVAGRRGWGHVLLLLSSLALLGRFVPVYFRHPLVWPSLVIITLATVTFGFALLSLVLERYQRPSS